MTEPSGAQNEILDTLEVFNRDVISEAWADEVDIRMEATFSDDLELESIEFVALAEKLQRHYGDKVRFVDWLSTKDLDEIIGLKVGDVVEFIAQCH